MQPPAPFANPQGTVNTPAPPNRNYRQSAGSPAKKIFGTSRGGSDITDIGCASAAETSQDMLDAVGEPRLPKGYNSIISGRPN